MFHPIPIAQTIIVMDRFRRQRLSRPTGMLLKPNPMDINPDDINQRSTDKQGDQPACQKKFCL
jgi:hypothetical protein